MENQKEVPCWVLIGGLFGILLFCAAVWSWPSDEGNRLAWVQAIGSVFAIYASSMMVFWQTHEARKSALKKERREQKNVVRALLDAVDSMEKLICGYVASGSPRSERPEDTSDYEILFRTWGESLRMINPLGSGLTGLLIPLMDLRHTSFELARISKKYTHGERRSPACIDEMDIARGTIRLAMRQIAEVVTDVGLDIVVPVRQLPEGISEAV